ncbi:hypothetical protein F511_34113 [Dorcoceras hygrometricum]|uniref:Dystroglycan-like n=1 Tax=Dorcoceras hygrometricum TaxID=472368 RepID=A0A2Z7BEB7_9LAMI|nr:hypothetical protein F511_34113 [Dorcoceras hygrometricum]
MRTRGDKRTSRKHSRKVLVAEESTKSWADTDSESSSSSSSSSDIEQEEVHCLMADQTSDDEVFDFPNVEFTCEDLVEALNDMVHEYKSLSHTFEEIKAENASTLAIYQESEMASSLISNSHHIDFDSVFGINDEGLVQIFESLIATGLKNFLGCPAIFYEAALIEFFENSSVRDGMVVSTIKGKAVEISDEVFATTFELPTEGLTDFSEKELKIEYHLLHDILAKTIFVKAGSFDAVTRERFMLMSSITFDVKLNWNSLLFGILKEMVTPGSRQAKGYAIHICVLLKNIPGLELGESRALPVPRVLNEKTMHRYVVINEKVGREEITDSPRLNKTPAKKALSKKRPAIDVEVAPVVKNKRTTKGKPLVIAQKAVPLQIVEGIAVAPVEHLRVPKRRIQKRKRRLVLEAEDDLVVYEPVVGGSTAEHPEAMTGVQEPVDEPVAGQQEVVPVVEATTDDPDAIIEQVLNQLDLVATIDGEDQPAVTGAEERHWFDLPYEDLMARLDAERPVVTASDTDEDMEQVFTEIDTVERTVGTDIEIGTVSSGAVVGNEQLQLVEEADEEMSGDSEQAVDERIDTDEAMSLEDIFMTIPVEVPLPSASMEITKITMEKEIKIPSVDERTRYLTSLPQIPIDDKRKEILVEKDPREGFKKPATINVEEMAKKEEQFLYWGETETIRVALNRKMYIFLKYREVLVRKFLESWKQNFVPGEGSSSTDLKVINMLSDLHLFVLEELKEQALAHGLRWEKTCCSRIFEGRIRDRGAVIDRSNTNTKSSCWIRMMIHVDGVWCFGRVEGAGASTRSLSMDGPVYRVAPRQSTVFALRVSQFCTIFIDYSLLSRLPTEDIRSFVGSIALERTVLRSVQIPTLSADSQHVLLPSSLVFESPIVQIDQSAAFADTDEHMDIDLSDDSSLHFDGNDAAAASISLPAAPIPNVTEALAQLRASIEQISERDDGAKHKAHCYCTSTTLRGNLPHASMNRTEYLGHCAKIQIIKEVSFDVRRVVRENHQDLNAKINSLDEQVAATRNDLLEFSAQAQQTLNRGGNDKKGEVGSSRGPQPPPDDQNRESGNTDGGGDTVRTTDIPQRDIDTA